MCYNTLSLFEVTGHSIYQIGMCCQYHFGIFLKIVMIGFGERLKIARGAESQASFAKKLGISQVAYSRYETDQREPGLDCLYQIGILTGASADWLLGLPERGGSAAQATANGAHSIAVAGTGAKVTAGGDCSKCKLMQAHVREITGGRI